MIELYVFIKGVSSLGILKPVFYNHLKRYIAPLDNELEKRRRKKEMFIFRDQYI